MGAVESFERPLMPCTPPGSMGSLVLGRKALVPSTMASGRSGLGRTVALEQRTSLACCRSALGSSCHIECGAPMMELGTLGRLALGRLELARGMLAPSIAVAGSLELLGCTVAVARSWRLGRLAVRIGLKRPKRFRA